MIFAFAFPLLNQSFSLTSCPPSLGLSSVNQTFKHFFSTHTHAHKKLFYFLVILCLFGKTPLSSLTCRPPHTVNEVPDCTDWWHDANGVRIISKIFALSLAGSGSCSPETVTVVSLNLHHCPGTLSSSYPQHQHLSDTHRGNRGTGSSLNAPHSPPQCLCTCSSCLQHTDSSKVTPKPHKVMVFLL